MQEYDLFKGPNNFILNSVGFIDGNYMTFYEVANKDQAFFIRGEDRTTVGGYSIIFFEILNDYDTHYLGGLSGQNRRVLEIFYTSIGKETKYEKIDILFNRLFFDFNTFTIKTLGKTIEFEFTTNGVFCVEFPLIDIQGSIIDTKTILGPKIEDKFKVNGSGLYIMTANLGGKSVTKKIVVGE